MVGGDSTQILLNLLTDKYATTEHTFECNLGNGLSTHQESAGYPADYVGKSACRVHAPFVPCPGPKLCFFIGTCSATSVSLLDVIFFKFEAFPFSHLDAPYYTFWRESADAGPSSSL